MLLPLVASKVLLEDLLNQSSWGRDTKHRDVMTSALDIDKI